MTPAPAPPAAIQLDGVTKSYDDGTRQLTVISAASVAIAPGELVAIVGPSGSGKSTLLHLAGGLDRRYTGRVTVAGRDLATLDDGALSAFRARTVGFVFQSFNLLAGFSALENVLLPGFFGGNDADDTARAEQALSQVGLADKRHRRPGELSGGERQRVALARALFAKPQILLADEPTGNLDARTGEQIIELLTGLNSEFGVTLVIVTHEERVSKAARRVLRLKEGQLVPEVVA